MLAIAALVLLGLGYLLWQYWKYKATDFGAPYVAMDPENVEAVLRLARVGESDVVFDLGSGDGRIPIMAGLRHNAHAVGIEIDSLRYYYSLFQTFILRLGDKVKFLKKDFFKVDLSPATVVVMFLLQETNEAMTEKLLRELKPGTRLVSAAFTFPNWKPVAIDENHQTPWGPIYLYQIGISNTVTPAKTPATNPQVPAQAQP